jgi:hypothetical protein
MQRTTPHLRAAACWPSRSTSSSTARHSTPQHGSCP